jgi:hypothetical protein
VSVQEKETNKEAVRGTGKAPNQKPMGAAYLARPTDRCFGIPGTLDALKGLVHAIFCQLRLIFDIGYQRFCRSFH